MRRKNEPEEPDDPGKPSSSLSDSVGNVKEIFHSLSDEAVDAMTSIFAEQDTGRTFTRRLVENYLSKKRWYNPQKDVEGAPSLSKAYAFFEHITLPRYFVGDHTRRKAEPGETEPTRLYDPICFKSANFIEWGIGVDQYFTSLRMVAAILLIGGLLHLPNILYFAGDDYSPDNRNDLAFSLQGSMICTTYEWVACVDCAEDYSIWDTGSDQSLYANYTSTDSNSTIPSVLVRRNRCDLDDYSVAYTNYGVFFIMWMLLSLATCYLGAREVRFDEDKLTATDYSVVVRNPPPDAYDPEEWRDFFSQFAVKQVTCVTVALDNKKLLNKMIQRRTIRRKLEMLLPKDIDIDNEDEVRAAVAEIVRQEEETPYSCLERCIRALLKAVGIIKTADKGVDRLFALTDEIKELQKEKYNVANVYVTFESEAGQRAALNALNFSRFDIVTNFQPFIPPSALFRQTVLKVEEPGEPDAIRWLDLGSTHAGRTAMNALNFFLTMVLVAGAAWVVFTVRYNYGSFYSAQVVALFNSAIPIVVKLLMKMEPHLDEGDYQASLFVKIAIFRWINTALLNKLITPFISTLGDEKTDAIIAIRGILVSQLYLTPALQLIDIMGTLKKHLMAPRARTQELMNLNFVGTQYNLGERYTDMTKTMFVAFFYSALYPPVFFFAFLSLVIQYYTDQFSLTRIWGRTAAVGSELAAFCRRFFFFGAVVAYIVASAYTWVQFPYDYVCDDDLNRTGASGNYYGVKFLNGTGSGDDENIVVNIEQDAFVVSCDQQTRDGFLGGFPPWALDTYSGDQENRSWLESDQVTATDVFGLTAFLMVVGYIMFAFGKSLVRYLLSWVCGTYEPSGQEQHIDFSSNTEIFGYVPQIKRPGNLFPFLVCNIDDIDQNLVGWNDQSRSYDYHNLIFDVPWDGLMRKSRVHGNTRNSILIAESVDSAEVQGAERERAKNLNLKKPIYSIVTHYPPPWMKKLKEEEMAKLKQQGNEVKKIKPAAGKPKKMKPAKIE